MGKNYKKYCNCTEGQCMQEFCNCYLNEIICNPKMCGCHCCLNRDELNIDSDSGDEMNIQSEEDWYKYFIN